MIYGNVSIAGEGLWYFNHNRHSYPLRSESFLAFNTYCDTVHPFLWLSPRLSPWISNLLRLIGTCIGLSYTTKPMTLHIRQTLYQLSHCGGKKLKSYKKIGIFKHIRRKEHETKLCTGRSIWRSYSIQIFFEKKLHLPNDWH